MITKVYRSGAVAAPVTRGVETDSYAAADAVRPEGRQGRTDGIFAAPTLTGVARWTYANSMLTRNPDPFVREITVDADNVYVYSVAVWESCSWEGSSYENYWKSGVTLTEWLANQDNYDDTEWELLLSPEDVIKFKNVSDKRLCAAVEDSLLVTELPKALKSARYSARF